MQHFTNIPQHFTNIPLVKLNGKWISGNTLVIGPNGNTFLASDLAATGTFPAQVAIGNPHISFGTPVIGNSHIGLGNHVMMSHQPSHPLNDFSPFGLQPIAPRVKDFRNM